MNHNLILDEELIATCLEGREDFSSLLLLNYLVSESILYEEWAILCDLDDIVFRENMLYENVL